MPQTRRGRSGARTPIPFRSVNRRGSRGYNPSLQRHHLLPLQVLGAKPLQPLLTDIRISRESFDDFRRNGMLLPSCEKVAMELGLPLHRGPHRAHNEMVLERVGEIDIAWQRLRMRTPLSARCWAGSRLYAMQGLLRAALAGSRRRPDSPFALNSRDPIIRQVDYSSMDAMADTLWGATGDPPSG